jgi:hypothetical protein
VHKALLNIAIIWYVIGYMLIVPMGVEETMKYAYVWEKISILLFAVIVYKGVKVSKKSMILPLSIMVFRLVYEPLNIINFNLFNNEFFLGLIWCYILLMIILTIFKWEKFF